jgi:hypothetical protein
LLDLQQAALDGEITIWARPTIAGPLDIVAKMKFEEYTFDIRCVFEYSENTNLSPQYLPKVYERGHIDDWTRDVYYEPHFCKSELKRVFPRKWYRFFKESNVVKQPTSDK